ncbi:MAG: VOC family protein [Algoriphagus sp.]|nr:VOC family protein [Algoriphagus sp.]
MLQLSALHPIALICSDYALYKKFYTQVLGFKPIQEVYRAERRSYKLDLKLNGTYLIELFSFPVPPSRVTGLEACGLRHLAFAVADIQQEVQTLTNLGIKVEPIRVDEYTGKKFTFFSDPDELPIELYQN